MSLFQTENLRVDVDDGLALLQLDVAGRSVNVLNRRVFADLDAALDRLAAEPNVRWFVLRGAKPSGFLAGADLNEFAQIRTAAEAAELSAAGQRRFDKLENLKFPTLAVLVGPCLGGGLEAALACDYRVVVDHPRTQCSLPEVELGLLPAWGGTQRLPRVIGLERALRVILGGRRLNARAAKSWRLADLLVDREPEGPHEPRSWNSLLASLPAVKKPKDRMVRPTWRQRLLESTGFGRTLILRGAERLLRRRVPDDMPAPQEALNAVRTGLVDGREAGFGYEREAAGRLATSAACRNLITLFHQREQARRLPVGLRSLAPPPVRRAGVVGAGAMGAGIAQLAALRGGEVVIQEINDDALGAGMLKIAALFDKAAERGLLTRDEARTRLGLVRGTNNWKGFGEVEVVVEAALEDLDAKRDIFRQLEAQTRPDALLATNTSSLSVAGLQEGLMHPGRVGGLHFFNPVHKMPLVEVIRAPATSEQTVAVLAQWAIDLGKTPVIVKDSPGFLVNRVLMPYLNEAVTLVAEGLPADRIDPVLRRFGMPMGPLELLDEIGLDVAAHVAQAMKPVFGDRWAANPLFERMVGRGWLGKKGGVGFYRHRGKATKANEGTTFLVAQDSAVPADSLLKDLPPAVQAREVRDRLVLPMVNEAAACVAEGLVDAPATADLAMVLGTGWAPHRGGPLRYADDRGLADVVQSLDELARRLGPRFQPCAELTRRAASGSPFRPSATKAPDDP